MSKKSNSKEVISVRELDIDIVLPTTNSILERGNQARSGKIVVIGKTGTGKSTLIKSMLYEKSHILASGIVFSGTEDSNHFYKKIFPDTFVYNHLDMKQLKSFVKRQKLSKQYTSHPWSVLLIDDCTDDPKIFNDPLFQELYKLGSHYNMLYILSLQYCMDIKPSIRTNIDGVFILREPNLRNRKSLYENFAGIIPSFKLFCDLMDQITVNYTALYIHNATDVNDWRECVFWYKAGYVPEDFRVGSEDFWHFHHSRYNEKYSVEY